MRERGREVKVKRVQGREGQFIMAALKEKRNCGQRCEDFGRFVWNSDEGKLLGRTPEKWGKYNVINLSFAALNTVMQCSGSVLDT